MSRLNDLINKLCPDGVEFVKLGDVCDIKRGVRVIKKDLQTTGSIPVFQNSLIPLGYKDKENYPANTTFVISAGAAGDIGYSNIPFWAADDCLAISCPSYVVNKFIYYFLKSNERTIKSKVRKASVPRLSRTVIENIPFPLPPLPIQEEIVRILDNFAELEAELEAELDCRKRQYEYYRDRLLSFEDDATKKSKVVWKKMSEVGTFIRGKRFVRTDIIEEGVPCIHYGDMYMYYGLSATKARTHLTHEKAKKMRFASKDDVIIVGAGENNWDIGIGLAWLGDEDVAVHDACYIFKSNMNPKFVSHYLRGNKYHKQIKKYVCEGKICSISAQGIGKAIIPIPTLEEQNRIVSILDRFESLTTDLQNGLPAEIAARRQQYEYYRDKLLTFKKKDN